MKKLIIAEKPSLAMNIVRAIGGQFQKKDGYLENSDYIVSFAYGHLFGLIDIEEYSGNPDGNKKWTLNSLPFFPDEFRFDIKKANGKTDAGAAKQFGTLKKLMNQNDVGEIIHCGDADREGEVIIRLIIQKGLKTKKKITRLWLPEQTEETIRESLRSRADDSQYDNLFQEGLTRTYIDWLYGINYTRYLTVKAGQLFHVGRVLTPIVSAVYEKEMEIRNFTPGKYLKAESVEETDGEKIRLSLNEQWTLDELEKAQEICSTYNQAEAAVTSIQKKEIKKPAGKLFSLSKLQGMLGRKYKMSMKDSLAAVQSLYEKGFVTYPRTNTEYLAENEKGKIRKTISLLAENNYNVAFRDSKTIFNDSKIESHSALTPTAKLPGSLSGNEKTVYETILNRFLSIFCAEECIMENTTITIHCIDDFKISGNTIRQKGYLKYEPLEKADTILPDLQAGDLIAHRFQPAEKTTKPPKRYSIETLNQFLKNPFRKEGAGSEEEEYRSILEGMEIGTEATRTGIIDNAARNAYISLKNNQYYLEQKGETVIRLLEELDIDMSKTRTIYLQQLLKSVYKESRNLKDVVAEVEMQIGENFKNREQPLSTPVAPENNKQEKEAIGKCPKCNGSVYENSRAYSCGSRECKFALWKTGNKYFEAIGFSPSKKDIKAILKEGKVLAKNLKSKKGSTYSAYVKADFDGDYPKWEMEFPQKKKSSGKK